MTAPAPDPWYELHDPRTALRVVRPESGTSRIVYSLPHSGRYYPDSFIAQSRQSPLGLRASEDAFVDELVGLTAQSGVFGVISLYARAFCDVNRNALELDARLIRGELPKAALSLSARVKAGFGVIARRLSADQDIYTHPIDMAEVNRRLDLIYRPYHDTIRALIKEARQSGPAVLIDWHSMPSAALSQFRAGEPRPDIVLGNRHGEACDEPLVRIVTHHFEKAGLRVGFNKPFAGGYIVEQYGRPGAGVQALQIEVNRALYMDEARLELNGGAKSLSQVFKALTRILASQ